MSSSPRAPSLILTQATATAKPAYLHPLKSAGVSVYLDVYVLLQRLHTKLNTLAAGSCESVLSQFMLRGTQEADKNEGRRPGPYFRPKSNKRRTGMKKKKKKKEEGGGCCTP